jgi:hypothetical protein
MCRMIFSSEVVRVVQPNRRTLVDIHKKSCSREFLGSNIRVIATSPLVQSKVVDSREKQTYVK